MSYNDYSLSPKKLLRAFPNLPSSATQTLSYALLGLGFLGFLDALYLTVLHYKNAIPPCTLAHGCETVLTSHYATLFGIPISLIGVGYYLMVILITGLLMNKGVTEAGGPHRAPGPNKVREAVGQGWRLTRPLENSLSTLLLLLTASGLLVGIFLVFLQAFVLQAFCQYCLASELIDFLLFDCAWWLWRKNS